MKGVFIQEETPEIIRTRYVSIKPQLRLWCFSDGKKQLSTTSLDLCHGFGLGIVPSSQALLSILPEIRSQWGCSTSDVARRGRRRII